ncbi:MAG: hypothetical protein HXY38_11115 [Chloroflexi bacterium]|nr:hypothetical protein [Chloroflexota bacterium]
MKRIFTGLSPWHALVILIAINLLVALWIGNDYGQTWDEPSFYLYGERSYEAYTYGVAGKPLIPERHIYFLDLRYYGAIYAALAWKVVSMLRAILPSWGDMDVWHFVNFLFFQTALISLYFLAKRFVQDWTALFIVALFESQPLIFGHAFINPKDIPFMTFFLASITFGLYMVDCFASRKKESRPAQSDGSIAWPIAVLFGLFTFTYAGKDLIYLAVQWMISTIYNAPADSALGGVFTMLAGNSERLPVENYVHKASAAHLERLVLYGIAAVVVIRKIYSGYVRNRRWSPPFEIDLRVWAWVLVAGVVLGLAAAVRLLAPFAGILIAGYALREKGQAALPLLLFYFSIAAWAGVWAWPFLWDSPALNFLEAFKVMRDFPFIAEIRFMGQNVSSADLPWHYLPVLISIQLTEPLLVLALAGLLAAFLRKQTTGLSQNILLLVWFLLPVALQILLNSTVYDNFRQFLFILPPLLIFAGMAFEALLWRLRSVWLKIFLGVICLFPGAIGILLLHPVQYIYYNNLVGGVSGADGNYELDYWLTAYRLAAPFINANASQHANILAWGSGFNGAREDLDVYAYVEDADLEGSDISFEYAVISTRFSSHLDTLPDAPIVFEVKKAGALLAVVKRLSP